MKLSDYVANFIADQGIKHVFSVCGGGSMHLVNSVGSNERLKYVACHHEQGAAIAAEAYGRITGLGCALFTTGPGGTNAITGVACAWIDSIPVLYVSGQVTKNTLLKGTGLRQHGIQETDIVTLVRSITKYSVCVESEEEIRYELEKAVHLAKSGRKGPVWVDIPLDIQSKQVDPEKLRGFEPIKKEYPVSVKFCLNLLQDAKRPLLIVGGGARDSKIIEFIDALNIPVVTSWAACDIVADHRLHVGNAGLFGDRASNFAVQKSDVIISLGCRLSVGFTGHDLNNFAKNAKIIMVDVDHSEIGKPRLKLALGIHSKADAFVEEMLKHQITASCPEWLDLVESWKVKYPVCLPEYGKENEYVNPYHFIEKLSETLDKDAVVALDVGVSYNCVYQAAKMKLGQRWINDTGHSTMGYALPAAIGAAFATGKKVVCLTGDGGFQMNLQELATIMYHNLPIQIFVFNNEGYLALKATQDNHFGHRVGVDYQSGIGFPELNLLASAYGLRYRRCRYNIDIDLALDGESRLCELVIDPNGKVIPRVQSDKMPDGSVVGKPIEDMYPYLPKDEFDRVMNA